MVLGSIFEFVLNKLFIIKIPSMAHIFIVLPIGFIFHGMRRNRITSLSGKSKKAKTGIILSDFEQLRFYQYLSTLFLLISTIYLSAQSVLFSNHYKDIQFCLALLITGIFLLFLPRFSKGIKNRSNIMIVTVNTAEIMMIFFFYKRGIYNIVWPFPILIIFISILYNKRLLLNSVATLSITINIFLLIISNTAFTSISLLTYLPRIVFFSCSAIVASYIHRVYLNRLNENESQMEYQKMISWISSKLVSINKGNIKAQFDLILESLGVFSKAQDAFLICYGSDNRTVKSIYLWGRDENDGKREIPEDFSEYKSDQLLELMLNKNLVFLKDIDQLPSEFIWIKDIFPLNVKSLIALAIIRKGKILGILGLDFNKPASILKVDETAQILKIPANLLGDTLLKIKSEQKINYMAFYDALTGLPNRSLYYDRLERAIALAERTKKIVAVIMMDLDSFKNINDSMGHDAGDLLLRRVAEVLTGRIRDYDTMSRFGGDEFLFILSQLNNQNEVATITRKLLKALAEPISIAGEKFYITGSMGISC